MNRRIGCLKTPGKFLEPQPLTSRTETLLNSGTKNTFSLKFGCYSSNLTFFWSGASFKSIDENASIYCCGGAFALRFYCVGALISATWSVSNGGGRVDCDLNGNT